MSTEKPHKNNIFNLILELENRRKCILNKSVNFKMSMEMYFSRLELQNKQSYFTSQPQCSEPNIKTKH
jgi:hypothetical protein